MRCPTRLLRALLGLMACATALAADEAQGDAIQAKVRAGIDGEGPFWVGQAVPVRIEFLSTGFSFSGQRIELPKIPGVITMPPDSSAVKGSERIDGDTWQSLRYTQRLFPLRGGNLAIPPAAVSFAVSAGYGQAATAFEMVTEGLEVEVGVPPGLNPGLALVTSADFKLEQHWEPGVDEVKVGDALTRTLRMVAADVPGMVLPPIELEPMPGVAVYAAEPVVSDDSNRGSLTGSRVDKVTLVFERPGRYSVPGATLQWWNPSTKALQRIEVESLSLKVAPNPALTPDEPGMMDRLRDHPARIAGPIALIGLLLWSSWRLGPRLLGRWRQLRKRRYDSEPARYRRLAQACDAKDASLAYARYQDWLGSIGRDTEDRLPELRNERRRLEAVVAGYRERWDSAGLAAALKRARNQRRREQAHPQALVDLNPR